MIEHSGLVAVEDCICTKCKNPIVKNEFYHRISNEILCRNCDK